MHFSMRRLVGLMASLLLTTAGLAVTAAPAHAANGTITGTISAANRTVVAGTLRVQRHDGTNWVNHSSTFIGRSAPKTFSVSVPPGSYRVSFSSSDGQVLPSYFGDGVFYSPSTATGPGIFTVPDGGSVTRNVAYPAMSRVSGTITSAGEPVAMGEVALVRLRADKAPDFDNYAVADADGRYVVPSVPDGPFVVMLWRRNPTTGSSESKTVGGFTGFPADFNAPGLFNLAGTDQVRNYEWDGLNPAPAPLTAPSLPATAAVGTPLTVSLGTWTETPAFSYQWNRDGVAIPGATGPSYTPTGADAAKSLTVTVGAVQALNHPGSATTNAATVAKLRPAIFATKKVKKHKLKLRISGAGVGATGKVTVKLGKRTVGKGKVRGGKVIIKLSPAVKRGKVKLKVVYQGSSTFLAGSRKVKVKIIS